MPETIELDKLLPYILGLYGITIAAVLWNKVVVKFFKWILKQITTSCQMSNHTWSYFVLMDLLEAQKVSDKVRVIRFLNGKWGHVRKISSGVGPGIHLIKFNGKFVWIGINDLPTQYVEEKLMVYLTILGRDNQFFELLKKQLYELKDNRPILNNQLTTYFIKDNETWWTDALEVDKRNFNTIFLPHEQKSTLINFLSDFYSKKTWYLEKGIPYQAGVLLYGPPGTGKSSIIKAVASHFNKHICILRSNDLIKMQAAVIDLPRNAVMVLEDVDSNEIVLKEEYQTKKKENKTKMNTQTGEFSSTTITLSDILNILDGIMNVPGRVIFMTTNHIEKLQESLIRPGRIDLRLEIGYTSGIQFQEFIKCFYGENIGVYNIKPEITIGQLQNEYLINKLTVEQMIEKFCLT
jgi:chaperone BCS1